MSRGATLRRIERSEYSGRHLGAKSVIFFFVAVGLGDMENLIRNMQIIVFNDDEYNGGILFEIHEGVLGLHGRMW